MEYSKLNLPAKITIVNKGTIEYRYDAAGIKLKKTVRDTNGNESKTASQLYVGNYIYDGNGQLVKTLHDEGYITPDGTLHYFLRDHLGNTRVDFAVSGTATASVQDYHYYPFGMDFTGLNKAVSDNKLKYNGKELQEDHGLDWYDYGARFYDAALGRWHVSDPKAEKYLNLSSYAYCGNNPILFIDPNGMEIVGDTAAVRKLENNARNNVTKENSKIQKLRAKAQKRTRNGKSTKKLDRKIAKAEVRRNGYQSTIDEIATLRESDVIYNVNTSYNSENSDGSAAYAGTNSEGIVTIDINVSQSYLIAGGLAHELVHAYQFETGQIDFQENGSPGVLYDISDEVVAFLGKCFFHLVLHKCLKLIALG